VVGLRKADAAKELMLAGLRAVPEALTRAGYQFRHRTIAEALAAVT
jgi:NAD dependent epimerase/dehydratase family enzyme